MNKPHFKVSAGKNGWKFFRNGEYLGLLGYEIEYPLCYINMQLFDLELNRPAKV